MIKDLRYGLRMLTKNPGVSAIAVLTLALGIGANTAIFSVVSAVLLNPLPYKDPDRLVSIWENVPEHGRWRAAPANFLDWKKQATVFEDVAAFGGATATLTGDGDPEQLSGTAVTPGYFEVVGVQPAVGRTFQPEEYQIGRDQVVILGHNLWQRRYGGDKNIINRNITLNGRTSIVVGVMPPGLYPTRPTTAGRIDFDESGQDFWRPMSHMVHLAALRGAHILGVVARLKPEVTFEQATAEMNTIGARLAQEHAENKDEGIIVNRFMNEVVGDVRPALVTLLVAVGLVLLIACANIAGLLLAQHAARTKEIAIRAALGAGRTRLVRQFFAEGLLLSVFGTVAGLAIAQLGLKVLMNFVPPQLIPRLAQVGLDWRVLGFTLVLSLATCLLFGLVPAWQASKPDLQTALEQSGRTSGPGAARLRFRQLLVVFQVSVAVMLVIGAGLLIKSFWLLQKVDPGFKAQRVLSAGVTLPVSKYDEPVKINNFFNQLKERVAAVPGVESVTIAYDHPLQSNWLDSFEIEGRTSTPATPDQANFMPVGHDYFNTVGVQIVKGRAFTPQDDQDHPGVAIVNEAFVRHYFPGEDPIGRRIRPGPPGRIWDQQRLTSFEIIGVVRDVKFDGLAAASEPAYYLPATQAPLEDMMVLVRTSSDPKSIVAGLRQAVWSIDPNQPISNVNTLEQIVSDSIAQPRLNMLLMMLFGGLALLLSAVGIYGLLSYAVTQRTQEMGIRMALGANVTDVLKLVLKQGMFLALIGEVIGLAGAFALTRLMRGLLFGVTPTDTTIFAGVIAVLTLTAFLACYLPARRATKVDPLVALSTSKRWDKNRIESGYDRMDILIQDVRYGLKQLWKSKGVTIVAIVSLAVGIGANSVIFSVVNSFLLTPRVVSAPEQLVQLYTGDRNQPYQTSSYPTYQDFRERNEVFSGLAAYGIEQFKLDDGNQVEQVWGEFVTGNYFDVLGVSAVKGRTFLPEEDAVPKRDPVVVIGHSLWQRRFHSDPALVGKTIGINNQQLTVIGIAPPKYNGMIGGLATEVWVPLMMTPLVDQRRGERALTSRGNRWLTFVGRLKPDTTIAQARARFDLITEEMREAHPEEWRTPRRELTAYVMSESETRIHPGAREMVWAIAAALFVTVNLVLLIACINLASMLLARAVGRRNEIAVRLALGARRSRIVRQLLTESVLLALIAGAAGLLLAVWLLDLAMAFMPALPEGIRVAVDLRLDWRVLVYTMSFATVTGLLFGLVPALHSSKAEVATVLKDDSSLFSGRYRKSRLRMSLVVAQVAFSLLLLIGAGLVWRSLEKVRPTRVGFTTDNILLAPVTLDETRYDRVKTQEFYRNLSERVAALPGVQAVSLVNEIPGGVLGVSRRSTDIEGYKRQPGEGTEIDAALVGPLYFTNMKVPIVQGRDFNERDRDGAPCVAIVNEAFTTTYFGGASPLGKHLSRYTGRENEKEQCEIVGVIRDNAWQVMHEPRPFFAMALQQTAQRRAMLMVNAATDAESLTAPLRQVIRDLDRTIPVADVQTLPEFFSLMLYPFRLLGALMAACGLMVLLLASIGIYGVVSYSVAQRTREVGIRIALGASQMDIVKLIVRQAMLLVVIGLSAGLLLALILMRVVASVVEEAQILFGVSTTDSLTFAAVTILLALVALLACYLPALRATRVDPVVALRYE